MSPRGNAILADRQKRESGITMMNWLLRTFVLTAGSAYVLTACTPTVQVAVPDKPITINLNIKIEHEIRVKVEKELDELFKKDSGLF